MRKLLILIQAIIAFILNGCSTVDDGDASSAARDSAVNHAVRFFALPSDTKILDRITLSGALDTIRQGVEKNTVIDMLYKRASRYGGDVSIEEGEVSVLFVEDRKDVRVTVKVIMKFDENRLNSWGALFEFFRS